MRALVACPHRLLLVDVATREVTVLEDHRPEYYGVSWTHDGLNLCLSHSGIDNGAIQSLEDYVSAERGTISLGARQTGEALTQPHQLLCTPEHVIAANTGRNCLTVVRQEDLFYRHHWLEESKWDRMGRDRCTGSHFNSVFLKDDRLFVLAHNHQNPSYLLVLDWPSLETIAKVPTPARWAHNIWPVEQGFWITCDTKRGALIEIASGKTIWSCGRPNSLTRGLACDGSVLLIGDSAERAREARADSHGGIYVLDVVSFKLLDYVELPYAGMVHEIRLLDVPDLCHHGHVFRGQLRTDPEAQARYGARAARLRAEEHLPLVA